MANYVIISASPRKANSDKIAEFIKNSLEDEVELFDIKSKKTMFCQADNGCKERDECVMHDDTFDLINKLKDCDAAFFVSPVYFGRLPGMAYTVIDRFYSKLNPDKELITIDPNKKLGIVLTYGKSEENYVPIGIETGDLFSVLGFGASKTVLCENNNDPAGFVSKQDQKDAVSDLIKWTIS